MLTSTNTYWTLNPNQKVQSAMYSWKGPWQNVQLSYLASLHGTLHLYTYSNPLKQYNIQSVPWGKVNILGGHSIGYSKQKVYMYVSYSERFLR
jgi:hypothetical protein